VFSNEGAKTTQVSLVTAIPAFAPGIAWMTKFMIFVELLLEVLRFFRFFIVSFERFPQPSSTSVSSSSCLCFNFFDTELVVWYEAERFALCDTGLASTLTSSLSAIFSKTRE